MAFDVPILFLVFNRPETTRQVFQRIKEIKPAKLFIAADGPRAGKEGEEEKTEAVRRLILDGIDWPCEVKTLFRFHNLGCGNAVSTAITWFFDNVEEGIILEDDTLPDPSFFNFCKILLEKYRYDNKIEIIGGSNFQNGKWRGGGSYYFSAYSHIWGWASWRRTWKKYDFTLNEISIEDLEKCLQNYFDKKIVFEYWERVFQQVKNGLINTWDYQLLFSIWKNDGLSILPNVNLVSNIGFGEFSTHTTNKNDKTSNIPLSSLTEIIHPSKIVINQNADWYYFKNYIQSNRGLFQRIKNRIIRVN